MFHLSQKACQRAVYLTINLTTGQLKYFNLSKCACLNKHYESTLIYAGVNCLVKVSVINFYSGTETVILLK